MHLKIRRLRYLGKIIGLVATDTEGMTAVGVFLTTPDYDGNEFVAYKSGAYALLCAQIVDERTLDEYDLPRALKRKGFVLEPATQADAPTPDGIPSAAAIWIFRTDTGLQTGDKHKIVIEA